LYYYIYIIEKRYIKKIYTTKLRDKKQGLFNIEKLNCIDFPIKSKKGIVKQLKMKCPRFFEIYLNFF